MSMIDATSNRIDSAKYLPSHPTWQPTLYRASRATERHNEAVWVKQSRASGFTLIELLVAVVVLAIGLLGMAGLQTTGLSTNQSAYYRTQATNAISDIIDRMRANPLGVDNGNYDSFSTTDTAPSLQACISSSAGCSPSELANYDLREWAKLFVDVEGLGADYRPLLPGASGSVTRIDDTDNFTIRITWQETDWSDNRQKAVEDKTLTMRVNL